MRQASSWSLHLLVSTSRNPYPHSIYVSTGIDVVGCALFHVETDDPNQAIRNNESNKEGNRQHEEDSSN